MNKEHLQKLEKQAIELEKDLKELEKCLTELKEKLKESDSKVFKPKQGEIYHFITSSGGTNCREWIGDETDTYGYAFGNCFKTEEEAEFQAERLKVVAQLKRFAEEHNEPLRWRDRELFYYICYDYLEEKIDIHFTVDIKCNDIYFSSKEIAQQAVVEIGEDRIKKYYLGVED